MPCPQCLPWAERGRLRSLLHYSLPSGRGAHPHEASPFLSLGLFAQEPRERLL